MQAGTDIKSTVRLLTVVTRPWLTTSLLLVSDLVALAVAGTLSVGLRYLFDGGVTRRFMGRCSLWWGCLCWCTPSWSCTLVWGLHQQRNCAG